MSKQERMMAQLAYIKRRLETWSPASHESRMLGDLLMLLTQTVGGEEASVGSAAAGILQEGANVPVHLQEQQRRGGVQLAPGVVQYPAAPQVVLPPGGMNQPGGMQSQAALQPAPIDVAAGIAAMGAPPLGVAAPAVPMPTPVPGLLADQALGGQAVAGPPPSAPGYAPGIVATAEAVGQPTPEEAQAAAEMEKLLGGDNGIPDGVPPPAATETVITPTKE